MRAKTGTRIEIDDEEIKRFKEEMEMPVHRSIVSNETTIEGLIKSVDDTSLSSLVNSLQSFAQIAEIAKSIEGIELDFKVSHLQQKMLLTVEEAAVVSGLSKAGIRRSLLAGDLPAIKEGGRWKIRPEDLRNCVSKKLTEGQRIIKL